MTALGSLLHYNFLVVMFCCREYKLLFVLLLQVDAPHKQRGMSVDIEYAEHPASQCV